jgi:hypothetical protein
MAPGILIPNSSIASSSGGPVTVDTIEVSAVSIPSVELKDFSGAFSYASSTAKDVQIEMHISICSTFSGYVCVPWPICTYCVSGGIKISSFSQISCLGDIAMAGGSFTMDSPVMDFGPFSMNVDPLGGAAKTTVATIKVTEIDMHCTQIPMPNPLGVSLGSSFPVQNPMDPMNVTVKETNMKQLDSNKISTPAATVKNIKALNIKVPSVKTKAVTVTSSTAMSVPMKMPLYDDGSALGKKVSRTGDANCSHLDTNVTLNVSSVILRIKGGIEFTGLDGKVTTSSASSGPFDINLALKGLNIKGLSLFCLKMPEIQVEL